MIDVENEIYTRLKKAINKEDSSIYVSSIYELIPKTFPACMIEQTDSYVLKEHLDSSGEENTNYLTYTISICAKGDTRKSQVKKILSIVDGEAFKLGLTRTFSQPITLQDNTNIYEIVSRYNCIISKNKTIYRR